MPSLESVFHSPANSLYTLLPGFPDYPTPSEVEATLGNISDSIPPVAWSSLQMVYRVLLTHHQAIAIYESAQTSWLVWHMGLGEKSVLVVGMEMLKHGSRAVLPVWKYAADGT